MIRTASGIAALALCIADPTLPRAARAASSDEVAALRAELGAMRADYEARLAALTRRVEAAEATAEGAESTARRAGATPPQASASPPASSASAFNPAMSVILDGQGALLSGQDGHRDIPGFLIGSETGRGPEGLSLRESELDFSANVDDQFYGFLSIALNAEDGSTEVDLEEAYFQTLALPAGFTLKAGQFFSGLGYLNSKHAHSWDFVDAPLAYEALLNTQFIDPGVQLSWVAATDLYFELGAEAFRGDHFPAEGAAHSGIGAFSVFGKLSGEVGTSHTWQLGASWLSADPRGRGSEDAAGNLLDFSGNSDLWLADLIWKWAPDGNYRERNLVLQAEYLHRHERGDLTLLLPTGDLSGRYQGDQDGFYLQSAYQFMPRWRVGARYDQLFSNNSTEALPPDLLPDGDSPRRTSAMLDFSNSEFSRFRLQWNHEWGGLGGNDGVYLQYIMSIGSHGAHSF